MQAVWYVPTLLVGGGLLGVRAAGTVRLAAARRMSLGSAPDG